MTLPNSVIAAATAVLKKSVNEQFTSDAVSKIYLEHALTKREEAYVNKAYANEIEQHKDVATKISSHIIPEGQDRLTIPLLTTDHPVKQEVESHLLKNKFHSTDYAAGHVYDSYDRKVKIGKALNQSGASKELIDKYATHQPTYKPTGNEKLEVVISRHPHDVVGMSQGTGWGLRPGEEHLPGETKHTQSCMRFGTSQHNAHIASELSSGTHVAWLVNKGDSEAKDPVSRITLRPYHTAKVETAPIIGHNDTKPGTYLTMPQGMHPDKEFAFYARRDHNDGQTASIMGLYKDAHLSTKAFTHAGKDFFKVDADLPTSVVHFHNKTFREDEDYDSDVAPKLVNLIPHPETHYSGATFSIKRTGRLYNDMREYGKDLADSDVTDPTEHFAYGVESHIIHTLHDSDAAIDSEEHPDVISALRSANGLKDYTTQKAPENRMHVSLHFNTPISKKDFHAISTRTNLFGPNHGVYPKIHESVYQVHPDTPLHVSGVEGKTILRPGKVYGSNNDAFVNTVNKFTETHFPKTTHKYVAADGIYLDGSPHEI